MIFNKYISWPVFLCGFITGLIYLHCIGIERKPIYIYPTPETVNDTLFKDAAGSCFQFYTVDTACPADKSKIKDIPIQI